MSAPEKDVRRAMMVAQNPLDAEKNFHQNLLGKIAANDIPQTPQQVTYGSLRRAMSDALKDHLQITDPAEQQAASRRADLALAPWLGRTSNGKIKTLMGKNGKLMKSEEGFRGSDPYRFPDGTGIETTGLALSPAYRDKNFEICPDSVACVDLCLGLTAGQYFAGGGGEDLSKLTGPRRTSLLRTLAFLHNPGAFAVRLHNEINAAKAAAAKNNNKLGVRLNVLSDIPPKVYESLILAHPDVNFYDYTKLNNDPIASNHHLTYSSKGVSQPNVEYDVPARPANPEKNLKATDRQQGRGIVNPNQDWHRMRARLDTGSNVAMAFSHQFFLPSTVYDEETGKRYRVVDGDTHDFRPLDKQPDKSVGVIIGLRNKDMRTKGSSPRKQGNAAFLSRGFMVAYDPNVAKGDKRRYGPQIVTMKKNKETGQMEETTKRGKVIYYGTPQNTEVRIAPQGPPQRERAQERRERQIGSRATKATGGYVPAAQGGFVTDPHEGMPEIFYAQQFPGIEHHVEEEEDTDGIDKWRDEARGGLVETHHAAMNSPDIAIRIARSVIRKKP